MASFTTRIETDGRFIAAQDIGHGPLDYDGMAQALIDWQTRQNPSSEGTARTGAALLAHNFTFFGSGTVEGVTTVRWERVHTASGSAFVATIGPLTW